MTYKKFINIVNKYKIDIGPKYKIEVETKAKAQNVIIDYGNFKPPKDTSVNFGNDTPVRPPKKLDFIKQFVKNGTTVRIVKKCERKKQDTSARKKQERSKWHQMILDGFSYEEIVKNFPEVTKGSYRKAKSRLKNI